MRSCLPTTPEPMVTGFDGWSPSNWPLENSARLFEHAPHSSRRAPPRRISCGRSSPSIGPVRGSCSRKLTSDIALAFLTDYPTPQSAVLLGEGRMRQFCTRHAYRGGKSAAELVSRLGAAPTSGEPITPAVLAAIIRGSVAQIRVLNAEIAHLERDLGTALTAHPKATLHKTLPRVANVSLAQLIAEIGPLLERCDNPEQVAAMCGAAPVTRASGKSRTVGFRYAANKPARVAITGFADNSRHSSAWAGDCYRRARARGARHPHAVRILARGWVRVIWACWNTNTVYDPSRHRGEQLLAGRT